MVSYNDRERAVYDPAATFAYTEVEAVYREDADGAWRVRLYQPQGSGPFPALLSVHGGAWTTDAWGNYARTEKALAASGLVVASIQLRRAPVHKYPASVADVNFGLRWLKAHARAFNASPDRAGTIGFSSGGHLVVLSALRPADPRYAALPLPESADASAVPAYVIAAWPVIDPIARYRLAQNANNTSLIASHLGYFVDEATMEEANPQQSVDSGERPAFLPPLLIIHGDADTVVPPSHVQRFTQSYRAAGGDADLQLFVGMPHGFLNASPGPEADRAVDVVKTFIARQLAPSAAGAHSRP